MATQSSPAAAHETTNSTVLDTQSIAAKLDNARFGKLHRKILVGSGLGWALDAMDVGLISFVIAALTQHWHITKGESGLIASVGFIGMALGASLGGLLADRYGRRGVFALTLLLFGVVSGASAFAASVAVLLVLRFFVGFGLGAELPVASTYVSEFSPARIRGRVIVVLEAFWAIGWTAAAVIGAFVVPAGENGWRFAFLLGALPALYAVLVRWGLPESPRWLLRQGRFADAERVVARLGAVPTARQQAAGSVEERAAKSTDAASAGRVAPLAASSSGRLAALLSGEFRGRTAALWTVWFCVNFAYYGAFIWIPSILVDAGFGLVKSFGFTLIMTLAQLPGYAAAGWLIEKWGRRRTLSLFLVGSAAAAVAFGTVHAEGAIIASGMLLSFFNLGAWGALYAVTPEMYPTSLRATGAGWAAGFGRIASIIAPLTVPVLLSTGVGITFAVFAGFFVVAAVAVWGLADVRGQALDER